MKENINKRPLCWYALQVFTSHEDKIKNTLEMKAEILRNETGRDDIAEVYVPKQLVYRKTEKEVKEAEQKVYPGYVFVRARLYADIWHLIKDVDGVMGFIGNGSSDLSVDKNAGQPIDDKTIQAIKDALSKTADQPSGSLKIGDTVRIKAGAFENISGTIEEIDMRKQKVKILIEFGGVQRHMEIGYNLLESKKN